MQQEAQSKDRDVSLGKVCNSLQVNLLEYSASEK